MVVSKLECLEMFIVGRGVEANVHYCKDMLLRKQMLPVVRRIVGFSCTCTSSDTTAHHPTALTIMFSCIQIETAEFIDQVPSYKSFYLLLAKFYAYWCSKSRVIDDRKARRFYSLSCVRSLDMSIIDVDISILIECGFHDFLYLLRVFCSAISIFVV